MDEGWNWFWNINDVFHRCHIVKYLPASLSVSRWQYSSIDPTLCCWVSRHNSLRTLAGVDWAVGAVRLNSSSITKKRQQINIYSLSLNISTLWTLNKEMKLVSDSLTFSFYKRGAAKKNRQKIHTLCEFRGEGVSKIWCGNIKKVVIFSHLEL